MKVVLDTNIWISSLLLPQSIPGRIINAWQQALYQVVISQPILDEIAKVMAYPKIQKRLNIAQANIDEYLTIIRFFTEFIELKETNLIKELRDNKDIPILNTLIISKSDYLVTGDQDLLVLNKQYPIISPAEFFSFLN